MRVFKVRTLWIKVFNKIHCCLNYKSFADKKQKECEICTENQQCNLIIYKGIKDGSENPITPIFYECTNNTSTQVDNDNDENDDKDDDIFTEQTFVEVVGNGDNKDNEGNMKTYRISFLVF